MPKNEHFYTPKNNFHFKINLSNKTDLKVNANLSKLRLILHFKGCLDVFHKVLKSKLSH